MITKFAHPSKAGSTVCVAAYPTLLHADTTLAAVWGTALRHDIDKSDPLAFYRLERVKARLRVFRIQPSSDTPVEEIIDSVRASLLGELGLAGKEAQA